MLFCNSNKLILRAVSAVLISGLLLSGAGIPSYAVADPSDAALAPPLFTKRPCEIVRNPDGSLDVVTNNDVIEAWDRETIRSVNAGETLGEFNRNRWAYMEVGILIGQMLILTQDKEHKLHNPKDILIPLIKKHIRNRKGESLHHSGLRPSGAGQAEILLEGYDIDGIEEVREGGEITGFSLPVTRNGTPAYRLIYNLQGGDTNILMNDKTNVYIRVESNIQNGRGSELFTKDDKSYFVIVNKGGYFGKFAKVATNVLMALKEAVESPASKRESTIPSIVKKWGLNEQVNGSFSKWVEKVTTKGYLGRDEVGYSPSEGFSFEAVNFVCSVLTDYYPEFADMRAEFDVVDEIALYSGVPINKQLSDRLKNTTGYLQAITSGKKDVSTVYNELQSELTKGDVWTVLLLLKWCGNVAELDKYPNEQQKARVFLQYFTRRYLNEHKDVLGAFADFVFSKVATAQSKVSRPEGDGSVKVAIMLTGAQQLGNWLKAKAQVSEKKIVFKELLLTMAMVDSLEHIVDIDTVFMTQQSKEFMRKYLSENGILNDETRHIVFVDTGFTGSINQFLLRDLRDRHIGEDFLLLGQFCQPWSEYLASGLNKQSGWEGAEERLQKFIFVMDDGFEASMTSPVRFHDGIQVTVAPTPRPWFCELVKNEMEILAGLKSEPEKGTTSTKRLPTASTSGKTEDISKPTATPVAVSPDSERIHTTNFQDTLTYIQAKENKRAKQAEEEPRPTIVALGTSWITGYEEGRYLQHSALNPLLTSMGKRPQFIVGDDKDLLAEIKKKMATKGFENARVIVLAGEETVTKDLTELNNGKNILLGVDNKYLVVDSYVRVMEMLEIASKLALDPDTPPNSPNIPMERRGSFWVFIPKAEPIVRNYEQLKATYKAQEFA